jgi:hypothetical protein
MLSGVNKDLASAVINGRSISSGSNHLFKTLPFLSTGGSNFLPKIGTFSSVMSSSSPSTSSYSSRNVSSHLTFVAG